jgi:hypothetical protein
LLYGTVGFPVESVRAEAPFCEIDLGGLVSCTISLVLEEAENISEQTLTVPLPGVDPSNPAKVQLITIKGFLENHTDSDACGGRVDAYNGWGTHVFYYESIAAYGYDGRQIQWVEGFSGGEAYEEWNLENENAGGYPTVMPSTQAYFNAYGDFGSWHDAIRAGAKEKLNGNGTCDVEFTWKQTCC